MDKNRIRGIRRRTSRLLTTKSRSIKGAGCKSGGCALKAERAYLGRSVVRPEFRTEGGVIRPDRTAEVSRRHSSPGKDEGLNERRGK